MVDSRKYNSGSYITVATLGDEVFRGVITSVEEGKYDKLDLTFESEEKLSLNNTNLKTLQNAYGFETDGWPGKEVKLVVGELTFANKPVESVLLTPITPPNKGKKSARNRNQEPVDDNIPFSDR